MGIINTLSEETPAGVLLTEGPGGLADRHEQEMEEYDEWTSRNYEGPEEPPEDDSDVHSFDPTSDDFLDPFAGSETSDPHGGPILVTPAGGGTSALGNTGRVIAGAVGLGVSGVGSEGDQSVDDIYRGVTGENPPADEQTPGGGGESPIEQITSMIRALATNIRLVAGAIAVLGVLYVLGSLFDIQVPVGGEPE